MATNISCIFAPKHDNSGEVELLYLNNGKIEKRYTLVYEIVYGSFKDNLVIIFGAKVNGKIGCQLNVVNCLNGEIVAKTFFEQIHAVTYIEEVRKVICYNEKEKSFFFLGMDLKNLPKGGGSLRAVLFKLGSENEKLEAIKLPDGPSSYLLNLNNELIGVYNLSGQFSVIDIRGKSQVTFDTNFNKDDKIPLNRVFNEDTIVRYYYSLNIGLFAWSRGGLIRKIASIDLKKENVTVDFKINDRLLFMNDFHFNSKSVLLLGLGKIGEKSISKLSLYDPVDSKVIWEKAFEQKFCSISVSQDKKLVELIDQDSGGLFFYDLVNDKINQTELLKILKNNYPILFQL